MSGGASHLTISVAMCTRNGAPFVAQQLESILAQTVAPDQIVVSDDDSTDDTVAIVRGVLARYPAIESVVLSNSPAKGITGNFEAATAACTGELIALSDQDDSWRADRLEILRDMFEQDDDLLLVNSDATLVVDDLPVGSLFDALEVTEDELRRMRDGQGYEQLLKRNLVTGATTVFRRSVLVAAAPFPEHWVHDEWIAIIAAATGPVTVSRLRLVDYRQHAGNAIGASKPTISDKIARLREPRAKRNERLVHRARELVERLRDTPGIEPVKVVAAEEKLVHESMRSTLPSSRLRRIRPILRAIRAGGYRRFSRGRRDILRDLVQPA